MSASNEINFLRFPGYQPPKIDPDESAERVVPYLDVAGEDAPIDFLFTLGGKYGLIARANLHTLQGTKKAGKSAAGLALIVAALKGEFLGITASRENLAVLWIDTEQDRNTLRQKARAVLSMAGLDVPPERLKIVTLRGYGGPADVLAVTLQAIEENKADFVFLDGVVDLCQAFNDEEKSRDVVRKLETYAEQYGAAILGLIHTNKRDNEARGHLGAIMQQKSAEIYQVNKESNTAQVIQPFSRFAPVPPFSFSFADDFKIESSTEAINKAQEETRARFGELFKDTKRLTAGELAKAYAAARGITPRQAQRVIKEATAAGVLFKSEEGRNVFYSFLFPADTEEEDEI